MKYRKDFVTNSSSSSFVCEICGATESGWDMTVSEAGMCECVNGHVLCQEHMLETPNREDMIKLIMEQEFRNKTSEELETSSDEELFALITKNYGEVPEILCPICQFIEYSQEDLAAYLLKIHNVPRDEVFEEVKKLNRRRKKLYDSEYITYVCQKHNLNPAEIVSGWKNKFGTYASFAKFIR